MAKGRRSATFFFGSRGRRGAQGDPATALIRWLMNHRLRAPSSRGWAVADLLPTMVPLHRVAKELGKATHVLVSASRAGTFAPLVKVGALWFVRQDELDAWFNRNHAAPTLTTDQLARIDSVARSEDPAPQQSRPRRPRARSEASS